MKKHLRDIVGMAGAALVSIGASMVYRPAGVILAGAFLVLLALYGFGTEKTDKKAGN
jgi:hypothetical protein